MNSRFVGKIVDIATGPAVVLDSVKANHWTFYLLLFSDSIQWSSSLADTLNELVHLTPPFLLSGERNILEAALRDRKASK